MLLQNSFGDQRPKHLLIDMDNGLVADDKMNYDKANDICEQLQSLITGCSFGEVKLQRKKSYTNMCHKQPIDNKKCNYGFQPSYIILVVYQDCSCAQVQLKSKRSSQIRIVPLW